MNDVWGTHAAGWAEHERQYGLSMSEALNLLGAPATSLDLGCGAGTFLRVAADRGARVERARRAPPRCWSWHAS